MIDLSKPIETRVMNLVVRDMKMELDGFQGESIEAPREIIGILVGAEPGPLLQKNIEPSSKKLPARNWSMGRCWGC